MKMTRMHSFALRSTNEHPNPTCISLLQDVSTKKGLNGTVNMCARTFTKQLSCRAPETFFYMVIITKNHFPPCPPPTPHALCVQTKSFIQFNLWPIIGCMHGGLFNFTALANRHRVFRQTADRVGRRRTRFKALEKMLHRFDRDRNEVLQVA